MDCFTGVSVEFPRKQKKFPFLSVESFHRLFGKLSLKSLIITIVSEFPWVETFSRVSRGGKLFVSQLFPLRSRKGNFSEGLK
jgi:hypothetical protein